MIGFFISLFESVFLNGMDVRASIATKKLAAGDSDFFLRSPEHPSGYGMFGIFYDFMGKTELPDQEFECEKQEWVEGGEPKENFVGAGFVGNNNFNEFNRMNLSDNLELNSFARNGVSGEYEFNNLDNVNQVGGDNMNKFDDANHVTLTDGIFVSPAEDMANFDMVNSVYDSSGSSSTSAFGFTPLSSDGSGSCGFDSFSSGGSGSDF